MHKSLATLAIVSSLCASFAVPAAASRILIPLHKQGSVLLVDDRRQTPNIAFPGIPGVHGLASDGRSLAVAVTDGTGGSRQPEIVLLDIRQPGLIATIGLPGAGGHVAVSPDSRFAAIVHPDLRSVSIVNLGERRLIATLSIDGTPMGVIFDRTSRELFISDSGAGRLFVVSMSSPSLVKAIEGLSASGHMVTSPDGMVLYAVNDITGTIDIVSLKTRKYLSTLAAGGEIHGIDISPDGETIYAADYGNDRVVAINISTSQRRTTAVQPAPYHLTTLSDTRQLIVTSAEQNVMWSISVPDMTLIGSYGLEGIVDQVPEVESNGK